MSNDIAEPTGKLHTLHLQVVKSGIARSMHILSAILMGVLGYTTCTTNNNLEYAGETRPSMYGSLTVQLAKNKSQWRKNVKGDEDRPRS